MESPRIDDLGSPRGTGRPETGGWQSVAQSRGVDESGRSPSPSLKLATTRPRSLPATARWVLFRAVPGGRFHRLRRAWLSHC